MGLIDFRIIVTSQNYGLIIVCSIIIIKNKIMSKMSGMIPELKLFLKEMVTFMSVGYVATTYGVGGTQCVGPSMLPTFREKGDFVLYDSFSYNVLPREYKKGDIVICLCPYDPSKSVCKRVAAVAGDTINIQNNDFSSIVPESLLVPPGHVWLLGDNPSNSLDSRRYGFVPTALIKGRVMCKLRFSPPFVHPIETLEQAQALRASTSAKTASTAAATSGAGVDASIAPGDGGSGAPVSSQEKSTVPDVVPTVPVKLSELLHVLEQQQLGTQPDQGVSRNGEGNKALGSLREIDRDDIRVAVEKIKRDSAVSGGASESHVTVLSGRTDA